MLLPSLPNKQDLSILLIEISLLQLTDHGPLLRRQSDRQPANELHGAWRTECPGRIRAAAAPTVGADVK